MMNDTTEFTEEQKTRLEEYLEGREISVGVGTKESSCSVAAINLAISGELTDDIPQCMSEVLGQAVISLQDAIPDHMRNSERYKILLPQMAGTGRDQEKERIDTLLDWMWHTVLPQLQGVANKYGFGDEWVNMCEERTGDAARTAARAAYAASDAARAAYAACTADRAARASAARTTAARAASDASDAAYAAARAAYDSAACTAYDSAACTAVHAASNASDMSCTSFWQKVDPIGVLERITFLGEDVCDEHQFSNVFGTDITNSLVNTAISNSEEWE